MLGSLSIVGRVVNITVGCWESYCEVLRGLVA